MRELSFVYFQSLLSRKKCWQDSLGSAGSPDALSLFPTWLPIKVLFTSYMIGHLMDEGWLQDSCIPCLILTSRECPLLVQKEYCLLRHHIDPCRETLLTILPTQMLQCNYRVVFRACRDSVSCSTIPGWVDSLSTTQGLTLGPVWRPHSQIA